MAKLDVQIRPLLPSDEGHFAEGSKVLNETQGIGLFAEDYLPQRVVDPETLVLGAFHNERLIGVAVAQVITSLTFYLPFDEHIQTKLAGKKLGSFSTLCFWEEFRGKGIGQEMSRLRLEWLKQKQCDVVLGVSWISGLAHTSDRVFQKMGFEKVQRVESFFKAGSLENTFICPTCGEPPCLCAGELYLKWLK